MASKASSFLFLALFSLFSSPSLAFNITRILSRNPDFSTFNNLLTQTGLAKQINSRQTITVLAVTNDAAGGLSGKPLDIAKSILGAHVILDYYDETKLKNLNKKSSILTTLFQTTGNADNQQGFLNVTKTPKGIMFGSAQKGAQLTASLEGTIASQPYNISVLQISSVIEPPGIDSVVSPPAPSHGAPKSAPSPAPTKAKSPAISPTPVAEEPVADEAPTEAPTEEPTPADAPGADAPEADAPEADAPETDAPVSSPPEFPADDENAPADPPSVDSASSRVHVGGIAAIMGLVACMVSF